jgi:hypothetical protein
MVCHIIRGVGRDRYFWSQYIYYRDISPQS